AEASAWSTPVPAVALAPRASAEAEAGAAGVGAAADAVADCAPAPAVAGDGELLAASWAIGSGWPSPGHWITRRRPPGPVSKRGLRARTGAARSNTMRVVPATGWPVRTPFTTPTAGGSASAAAVRLPGRSTTRRAG